MITVEVASIRVRPVRAIVWLDWLVEAALYFPDVDILTRMATRI